jgi:hypothetical protein
MGEGSIRFRGQRTQAFAGFISAMQFNLAARIVGHCNWLQYPGGSRPQELLQFISFGQLRLSKYDSYPIAGQQGNLVIGETV